MPGSRRRIIRQRLLIPHGRDAVDGVAVVARALAARADGRHPRHQHRRLRPRDPRQTRHAVDDRLGRTDLVFARLRRNCVCRARSEGIATPESQPAGARYRTEPRRSNRSRHCRGEIIAMLPCMPMGSRCARCPVTIYRARAATAAAITWSSSMSSWTTLGTARGDTSVVASR